MGRKAREFVLSLAVVKKLHIFETSCMIDHLYRLPISIPTSFLSFVQKVRPIFARNIWMNSEPSISSTNIQKLVKKEKRTNIPSRSHERGS